MFEWKQRKSHLDPYFRAVYIMELIAVAATIAGLFLVWWDGRETYTAFTFLKRSADRLMQRDVRLLGQPLIVLWLLWPSILISTLRGITGLLVTPVAFRRLALFAWIIAMLVLTHFYISFSEEVDIHSPLRDGSIQRGFWLSAWSILITGLLILTEYLIRAPEDDFTSQPLTSEPVSDAEKLWRGEYQTCPYCGMLNEPHAKSCYNCHNLLFDFRTSKDT